MKVFVCTRFKGHNPVGVSAVVIAPDAVEAAATLNGQLHAECLWQNRPMTAGDMIEVDLRLPKAYIINDGDY
jgi:hypothetical protein